MDWHLSPVQTIVYIIGPEILSKGLTGDNLCISRGMSEITSFDDIYFLATLAKKWIFYFPLTPTGP